MLNWIRQHLTGRQIIALAILAVVVVFGTVGRLNIETYAQAKGWDQFLVRLEGPVMDTIGAIGRFLGSDLMLGVAFGAVIFSFWGWIVDRFCRLSHRVFGWPSEASKQQPINGQGAKNAASLEKIRHLDRTAFLLSTAFVTNFYKQKIQEGLDWWKRHPRTGPFDNDSQIRTEVMRVEKFIDDLRTNIGPSHWGVELYRVVQEAEHAADHEVMLKKTAPDGLSPFEYRRFHIACTQYERVGAFLQRAIEEANSFDRQNLQMIDDRPEIHK